MRLFVALPLTLGFLVTSSPCRAEPDVTFVPNASEVDTNDYVEVAVRVAGPTARNPFRDVAVTGQFRREGSPPMRVEGFCDAPDGGMYRIRFLPTRPGKYTFSVTYRQGNEERTHEGSFTARDGGRKGFVRIDRDHPWHFVWEGTGEHYFWNGTTTYWLLGWED